MKGQLTSDQLRAREAELQARYAALREEIQHALVDSGESDLQELAGSVRDSGEDSVADLISGMNFQRVNHLAREAVAVETALSRIHEGSYRLCDDCDNEIDPERLRVLPSARRCIDCQSKFEAEFQRGATPSL